MVKWLKNPPAGAEDSGLIPSLGRVHVPQGNLTHASQPLKSVCPRDCALQHGKPPQPEAHTPSGEQPPPTTTRGSSWVAAKTQCSKNKNPTWLKNGHNWIDSFQKRKYRWPTGTWKEAQHHLSLVKYKSKPQWNITLHLSGWLSLKRTQIRNVGEDEEQKVPFYTAVWM